MKPIRLSISGLHSFRENQHIRFDELSDVGVFGIFGPTGSGKSSILDAMTLALYGTVGRAEHNTRGIMNHAERNLAVSFEFSVGAVEKTVYRVERLYKRKDELSVQNVRSRLIEVNGAGDIVLADKDSEVSASIKQILGLEVEDFTRAVVLPQGKFAEFLNLRGVDRNKMLQRLFSLERYGDELNAKLKSRFDAAERNLALVIAQQQALGDASSEALEKAEQILRDAVVLEQERKANLSQAKELHETMKSRLSLQQELEQVEQSLKELGELEDSVLLTKREIDQAERAEHVLPHLRRLVELKQTVAECQAFLTSAQREMEKGSHDQGLANEAYQVVLQALQQREPLLVGRRHELESARPLEQELQTLLNQYQAERENYRAATSAIEVTTEQAKNLEQAMTAADEQVQVHDTAMKETWIGPEQRKRVGTLREVLKEWSMAKVAMRDLVTNIQSRQATHDSLMNDIRDQEHQYDLLRRDEEAILTILSEQYQASPWDGAQLHARTTRLERVKSLAKQWEFCERDAGLALEKLGWLQAEQGHVDGEKESLQNRLLEMENEIETLRAKREELNTRNAEGFARLLAAQLLEGEPCPVCGSKHHPAVASAIPGGEDGDGALPGGQTGAIQVSMDEWEHRTKTMDQRLRELEAARTECLVEFTRLSERATQLIRDKEDELERQEQYITLLGELKAEIVREGVPAEHVDELVKLQDWTRDEGRILAEAEESFASWTREREETRARLESVRATLQQVGPGLAATKATFQACVGELTALHGQLEQNKLQVSGLRERLVQAVEGVLDNDLGDVKDFNGRSDGDLYRLISAGLKRLEELDQTYERSKIAYENAQRELYRFTQERDRVRQRLHALHMEQAKHETTAAALEVKIREKQGILRELTGERSLQACIAEVDRELDDLKNTSEAARIRCVDLANQLEEARRSVAVGESKLENALASKKHAEVFLEQQLSKSGFATTDEVEDAVRSEEELREKRKNVAAFGEKKQAYLSQRARLSERLGEHRISQEQWNEMQEAVEMATQEWREAIGALDVANNQLDTLQKVHVRWATLEEERQALNTEHLELASLRQVFSGNRFVEFIAQEQLEFVAAQASERLQQLTRNRYALEVAADGRFVMRDDHNGGVRRPVTTLSGGETFLTSLALALSLSTQIQLRGKHPLQFFFLDEGFGTLDGELLDIVMTTLERLRLEKMTIGVISHVPELRQRMQRRLIVQPPEPSGRGTTLKIEMA